jgi:hypothetical protein
LRPTLLDRLQDLLNLLGVLRERERKGNECAARLLVVCASTTVNLHHGDLGLLNCGLESIGDVLVLLVLLLLLGLGDTLRLGALLFLFLLLLLLLLQLLVLDFLGHCVGLRNKMTAREYWL